MNKHFQELAQVVGRALAKRWMQQCTRDEGGNARPKPTSSSPPARCRRQVRYQQHK